MLPDTAVRGAKRQVSPALEGLVPAVPAEHVIAETEGSAGELAPAPPAPLPGRAGWDDARLIRACLDGDQEAWAAIVHRYRRLIYSIPMRYGARPEDAADIFQAVCLELFAELPKLRRLDSLRAWLITVTAHQAFHWKRRHVRRATHEADEVEADAVAVAPVAPAVLEAAEREQQLRDAVRQLPPRCADLIRLLFYEPTAMPYKEIGRRLGVATGSIGFIRGRCLNKLQRLLAGAGFGR